MDHQGGEMEPGPEFRNPSPFLMTLLNINSKPASDPQCTLGNFSSSHLEGLPRGKMFPHCTTVLLMAQPATGYVSPRTFDTFSVLFIILRPCTHLVEPVSQVDHGCGLSHHRGFLGGRDNDSLPVVV